MPPRREIEVNDDGHGSSGGSDSKHIYITVAPSPPPRSHSRLSKLLQLLGLR